MPKPWFESGALEESNDPYAEDAINAATFILWSLSGRKYSGAHTVTETYTCDRTGSVNCTWDDAANGWFNSNTGTIMYQAFEIASAYLTRSGLGTRFNLRNTPVRRINSVAVGGTELNENQYSIQNNRSLSLKGVSLCDDPTVEYVYGVNPPSLGVLAGIELANELLLSYNGSEQCSLPERVQSVSREGFSFEMYDPQDFLDKGRTGLYKVDLFIASTNPYHSKKPAKVFSPDRPRGYTER